MSAPLPPIRRLLRRSSWPEAQHVTNALRTETVGGVLLLTAAVVAIAWANSPWSDAYSALRSFELGPDLLHLRLSLGQWAADGLLAVFFFCRGAGAQARVRDRRPQGPGEGRPACGSSPVWRRRACPPVCRSGHGTGWWSFVPSSSLWP